MSRHPEDFRRMKEIRAEADAILIGAGNLRADNPGLVLATEERERRRVANQGEPLRIALTTQGEGLHSAMKMFDPTLGGPSLLVHTMKLDPHMAAGMNRVAELLHLPERTLPGLLEDLAVRRGIRTLLCEGGGRLVAQLFALEAVDELYLTLTPRILGGEHGLTLADGPGFEPNQIPDGELLRAEPRGSEIFLHYRFTWAPPP